MFTPMFIHDHACTSGLKPGFQKLPCQQLGSLWLVLPLVGPMSVLCNWERQHVSSVVSGRQQAQRSTVLLWLAQCLSQGGNTLNCLHSSITGWPIVCLREATHSTVYTVLSLVGPVSVLGRQHTQLSTQFYHWLAQCLSQGGNTPNCLHSSITGWPSVCLREATRPTVYTVLSLRHVARCLDINNQETRKQCAHTPVHTRTHTHTYTHTLTHTRKHTHK